MRAAGARITGPERQGPMRKWIAMMALAAVVPARAEVLVKTAQWAARTGPASVANYLAHVGVKDADDVRVISRSGKGHSFVEGSVGARYV